MNFCVKEIKARCRASRAHHAVVSNEENFQPTDVGHRAGALTSCGTRASAPACNRAAISGVPPARSSAGLRAAWTDRHRSHQVLWYSVLLGLRFTCPAGNPGLSYSA